MVDIGTRLKNSWNAFRSAETEVPETYAPLRQNYGISYGVRPDRVSIGSRNDKSIVTAVYNQIALDVAGVDIIHARLDDRGRYVDKMKSGLQTCLELEANIDQTSQAFIQDLVISMFDEGAVAVVPIDTNISPLTNGGFDILSMRVAKILEWYPRHVRVEAYNDRTGKKEPLTVPKERVAIVENPLYAVINEPNSTMQRLIRKLALLDTVDEQSSSGKLDLIIQLPYVILCSASRLRIIDLA